MNIQIGDFEIGSGRTFVIAEIGNNHNGSFERAIEMIDLAIEMGADCAKFQMRHLDEVYRSRTLSKDGEDLGTEYVLDLLNRFELPREAQVKLAEYCREKGILYLCTPWDARSVDTLEEIGVVGYKVASADLTNLPLIERLVKTKKPLVLSTGMSQPEEVEITTKFLNARNAEFVLLHCNSTYPAPLHDINLSWIPELRKLHPLVGYSGHERGVNVSLAAVALGACVIERHFTMDRNMEGPDHAASLALPEFKRLIEGIREVETALGDGGRRKISQGEMINRENLGKSLVAARALKAGTAVSASDVKVRSPGQGISPQRYDELLGRILRRDMTEEDFFFASDISDNASEPGVYRFSRAWGVPVRYHDFRRYAAAVSPDFFEFHLSYSDMELDPSDYIDGTYDCGFVVHAPELFMGSHLMDLATENEEYRRHSLTETQRVIDMTRALKAHFPSTEKPMIVANIGGFTMDALLPLEKKKSYYNRFAESLEILDREGVEIIPQTMAPFPWHFGGQRFQNLFVEIEEIENWCKKLNIRMCFDVSHSFLTCNHMGCDFYEFAARMGPHTAYLHIGDAEGLNGEGLQVGEGEINFDRLGRILGEQCPQAGFIPEIWQGHTDNGTGFWTALERLDGRL